MVASDLIMPEYDGFYAFEQIIREDPDAKVVVLTTDTKKQDFERLQRLKPAKILSKPYDAYEMLDIIKDLELTHSMTRVMSSSSICASIVFFRVSLCSSQNQKYPSIVSKQPQIHSVCLSPSTVSLL